MRWYPLKLTTHVRSYAFGERAIPDRLGKRGLPEGRIAETWEVSDHADARATVVNGELTGTAFHDLVVGEPDALVGRGWRGPHFPLLVKLLDASHALPVHLHADDEVARRVYGEPNGKTEAWHILTAEPGATVLAGVRPAATRERLREAFLALEHDAVMFRHPVRAGDTVYVPGGTLHSFGPGVLVLEVQQTSDLGSFVTPGALDGGTLPDDVWRANIETALDELRTDARPLPAPGLVLEAGVNERRLGCAGRYFALERWRLGAPLSRPARPDRCLTLTNLGAAVEISFEGGSERLERAESCVLPAALGAFEVAPIAPSVEDEQGRADGASAGTTSGRAATGRADLVACYVPNLERDVVAPLRAAGFDDAAIAALGEPLPKSL